MSDNQFSPSGDGGAKGSSTVSDLAAKAHSVIDNVTSKARDGVESAAQGAHKAVSNTASKAQNAGPQLNDSKDVVKDKGADLLTTLSAPIQQNPLIAVAGAFAIGYLFGRLGD